MIRYKIDQDETTIKTYLRQHLGLSARVLIQLKTQEDGITVNGFHAKVTQLLNRGDTLCLKLPPTPKTRCQPEDIPLRILYEDDNFLAVDKPAYMPMYPVGKHSGGSLLNAVSYCRELTFRPIYRLDRNTSGIVLLAKNRMAASSCQIQKTYQAICCGRMPPQGVIDTPITLAPGSKIKRATGTGQAALTRFQTLAVHGEYSLIELALETGRTHQIRVHMASIGFPLAGDDLYGGETARLSRHALHCGSVDLRCFPLGIQKILHSEVPPDIQTAFPEFFT